MELTVTKVSDDGEVLEGRYISYDAEGNVTDTCNQFFSEDGLSYVSDRYDASGELIVRLVNEYDDYGNVI